MKYHPRLTIAAAALATAMLAAPAWSQSTTTSPSATAKIPASNAATNAAAGASAAKRAECYDAAARTWRTTGNCSGADASGALTGTVPSPNTSPSSPPVTSASKPIGTTQAPKSLKEQSSSTATTK